MSESALKAEIVKLAVERGWQVYTLTQNVVKRPQKRSSGYPDITLARRGVVKWIEVKDETRALEPEQVKWAGHLTDSGAIHDRWYVIRPSDLRQGLVERLLA